MDIAFAQMIDSDKDGLPDIVETNTGTFVSYTDTGTDPNNPDTDYDGMPDGWEVDFNLDPNDDGSLNIHNGPMGDPDGDGIVNLDEYQNASDPWETDVPALRVSSFYGLLTLAIVILCSKLLRKTILN